MLGGAALELELQSPSMGVSEQIAQRFDGARTVFGLAGCPAAAIPPLRRT
jgi:hypothetical protein